MTQTDQQRRLIRLTAAYNRDAELHLNVGRVAWQDLARIEVESAHCAYCYVGLERGRGTFDHAHPLAKGGLNTYTNIVRACMRCQRRKARMMPAEFAVSQRLLVVCSECGRAFRPRWGDYQAGKGRTCSRACAGARRHKGATHGTTLRRVLSS